MKKWISIIVGIIGAILVYHGVSMKINEQKAISIIGGADGPTAIFVAGKIGEGTIVSIIVIGVILVVGAIWYMKKHKK
ncbi:MAG: sodium ion-translocating decarboxylase subunit beta [Lachnospiraceae bacterium]|nr:sodium ion-translocating decarboxylase subunit beta [Lachnospiraceae bacterium]